MFSLPLIIELFAIVVIVASVIGFMWLGGHIYFRYLNWRQEQEDKHSPTDDIVLSGKQSTLHGPGK